jgi:hypothetical protein
MSTLETKKIEPLSGTTVTLGAAGDAVTLPAGVTVKTNTVKDAGGNTLWTSNGSGTLSSVNSALQGNMIFISSQTASASSSISFTSGIDSTYDEYVFYFVNIYGSVNNASFTFNGSSDAGSNYNVTKTTTLFTAQHNESGASTNLFYDTSRDIAQGTGFQILDYKVDGAPVGSHPGGACGDFYLYAPSSTTYVKHFNSTSQYIYYDVSSPYSTNSYCAGYFNTTSVVNAIRFQMDSGNITAGTIAMYGIR